jgi:hypothetical protein
MAKLRAGQAAAARSDFQVLTLLPNAPDNVRQRAHAAMALIDGGSPGAVGAIVKGALALPPQPATPANAMGAAQPGQGQPPAAQPAPDQSSDGGAAQ